MSAVKEFPQAPAVDAIPTGLHAKLVWVRNHVGNIEKSKKNENLRFFYRTEEDYYAAIRPLLDRVNVMLYASTVEARIECETFIVTMDYTLVDADSGDTFAVRAMGAGDLIVVSKDGRERRDSSGLKKATTGAARYFFQKCFLVADGTDDEAEVGGAGMPRANALTIEQAREIERLASTVGVAADEASQKAFGMPVAELQAAQAQKLIGMFRVKQAQQDRERAAALAETEPEPEAIDAEEVEPTPEQMEAFEAAIDREPDDEPTEAALVAEIHQTAPREPSPAVDEMPDEPVVSVPFSWTGAKAAARAGRTAMLGDLLASIGLDAKTWLRDTKGIKRWSTVTDDRVLELIGEVVRLERETDPCTPEQAADLISVVSEKKISQAAITGKVGPSFRKYDELSKREVAELFVWIESAHRG